MTMNVFIILLCTAPPTILGLEIWLEHRAYTKAKEKLRIDDIVRRHAL
jgi:hypothetical protein